MWNKACADHRPVGDLAYGSSVLGGAKLPRPFETSPKHMGAHRIRQRKPCSATQAASGAIRAAGEPAPDGVERRP